MKNLFVSTFLLVLAATATAASPPDFSGTWKLDTTRGENLGMMSALQQVVVITQSNGQLTLKEETDFQGQKSQREVHFDLSGAPVRNPGSMGGDAETAATLADGKLVVTWTTEGSVAGTKKVRTETRSLSADGQAMTVVNSRGTGKDVVMVYGKTE
ncbi:MAG: hypothetical protein AB7P31_00325 [Steroidobacteraceae bacterium]